jgi:hypothetical protein
MKFLLLFLLSVSSACAQTYDTYGGVTQKPCTNGVTGSWYTQQIGKRWFFCDPLGNAFIDRGVWYITGDSQTDATYVPNSFNTTTTTKYTGDPSPWQTELARMASWGFNAEGPASYPHATDSNITTKLPFTEYLSQANNEWGHCSSETTQCKNIWNLLLPSLHSPDPTGTYNITDAWDPNWQTQANTDFAADSNISAWSTSPYLIGFFIGDTDFCSFCSAGTDFPNSSYWPHAGYLILASAPHAWLNIVNSNSLYPNQTNNTKSHLSSVLTTEYTTIAALNTAWGSSYTAFGTTGTQVTGGACATGNGGSSYSCTPHTNIDRFSLRIDVAGTPVCADNGNGVLSGPANATCGTLTYSTGVISITQSVTNGAAITVDYWHDGYGVGTGLLDEWGNPSSHAWLGDSYCLNNGVSSSGTCNAGSVTTAAYRTDLNNFLQAYATQFFTVLHTAYVNALPVGNKNKLFFGVSSLGQVPGRVPARCQVLAGEAAVADVVQVSTDTSTAQLNFITNCIGNKPFTLWETVTANADSDWYGYAGTATNPSNVATQALRATQYNTDIQNLWNFCNGSTGNCQWVGENWWAFLSFSFYEHQNYGLISWRDNAYDGHEDVTATVTCSAPETAYSCGGEQNNYGNFLRPATLTNAWVDQQLVGSSPPPGPGTTTVTGSTATFSAGASIH